MGRPLEGNFCLLGQDPITEMRKALQSQIEREATPGAEKDKDASAAATKEGSAAPAEESGADVVKDEQRGESMEVDDTTSLATREPPQKSTAQSNDLSTTTLALTAARSAAMASGTERQITAQVSAAVNLELTKLELKMQQFSEMEALLQAERREVERMRQRLFMDRLAFRKRVRETELKMGGMKISVPAVERMGMSEERSSVDEGNGSGNGVEPFQEGMEGFMRHEI